MSRRPVYERFDPDVSVVDIAGACDACGEPAAFVVLLPGGGFHRLCEECANPASVEGARRR